jgi:hypothetical protein
MNHDLELVLLYMHLYMLLGFDLYLGLDLKTQNLKLANEGKNQHIWLDQAHTKPSLTP